MTRKCGDFSAVSAEACPLNPSLPGVDPAIRPVSGMTGNAGTLAGYAFFADLAFGGWIVLPSISIATYFAMRAARVSGFLAS